jgi:ubiquinone/menaquinone biosynthesis C-methylase UbiE
MLSRVLEPEVMDSEAEARDYDSMAHADVNRVFVNDFLAVRPDAPGMILDVGTGTAQIPIELCRRSPHARVIALDAAAHMIAIARRNIADAGLADRIHAEVGNARALSHPDWHFAAVISNSIVHHLADPEPVLTEMVRVCRRGGVLFVRDLLRPDSETELGRLVNLYAAGANHHQRQMFADSLRAALTLAEVREFVARLGFAPETVAQTSDRHWTWSAVVALPADA